jgi:hypothetical protein
MNVLRLTFSLEENAQHSLDLSSAVNLKSVMFQCGMPCLDVNWIKIAVESIKSSHIRMMTLDMSDFTTRENVVPQVPDAVYIQWLALDKVLVEYLTARSLKLNVTSPPGKDNATFGSWVERLLPNLSGKKMLEVGRIMRT